LGMGKTGTRDQGPGNSGGDVRANAYEKPPARAGQASASQSKQPRQVLEGYVKGGVVHLLEGELPDGIFVKIVRE